MKFGHTTLVGLTSKSHYIQVFCTKNVKELKIQKWSPPAFYQRPYVTILGQSWPTSNQQQEKLLHYISSVIV